MSALAYAVPHSFVPMMASICGTCGLGEGEADPVQCDHSYAAGPCKECPPMHTGTEVPTGPCMAATLAPEADPRYAASFHWCKGRAHADTEHTCFCGMTWDQREAPLYPLTKEMVEWRLETWETPDFKERETPR